MTRGGRGTVAAACALRWTRVRSTPDVLSYLVFVVGVLVVGGLLFLGASLLLGRGETSPRPTRRGPPSSCATTARSSATTCARAAAHAGLPGYG